MDTVKLVKGYTCVCIKCQAQGPFSDTINHAYKNAYAEKWYIDSNRIEVFCPDCK